MALAWLMRVFWTEKQPLVELRVCRIAMFGKGDLGVK
jgi:hypothetical protein